MIQIKNGLSHVCIALFSSLWIPDGGLKFIPYKAWFTLRHKQKQKHKHKHNECSQLLHHRGSTQSC